MRGIDSLLPPILGERAAFSKLCTGISGGHYRRLPAPVLLHLYHACARRRVRLRSAYAEGMPGYPARFDIFDVLAWMEQAFREWYGQHGAIQGWHRNECQWIAKSVVRYCRRNLASGDTQQNFSFIQAERGRKSGAKRRERMAERDAEIVARAEAGESIRSVSRAIGLDDSTVRHILRRGAG